MSYTHIPFCNTCNSKQDIEIESFDSGGHHEKCARCGNDMGQIPFNRSKWWMCGCDEPVIHNEYLNTEPEEDIVYVNFKAICLNCKKEWEWRNYISFEIIAEEVRINWDGLHKDI